MQSDPQRSFVEAWTPWHLPFMKLAPVQSRYRACLRGTIKSLAPACGIRATYISDRVTRNLDIENVLFYNVGAAPFRHLARQVLRFGRYYKQPPPAPKPLAFEPQHYVRYQGELREDSFHHTEGVRLAYCAPIMLASIREMRDKIRMPRLWWLF